jgi:flagellar basal-body rod protein FlgC
MDFLDALNTSASGLSAQRLRMNLISGNLANVSTTRTPEGGPYRRKDAVFAAVPAARSFQDELAARGGTEDLVAVRAVRVVEDQREPLRKYDPQHPDADAEGFVDLPNINSAEEMVNLISASRSYEANIAAVRATKNMIQRALEIGR